MIVVKMMIHVDGYKIFKHKSDEDRKESIRISSIKASSKYYQANKDKISNDRKLRYQIRKSNKDSLIPTAYSM